MVVKSDGNQWEATPATRFWYETRDDVFYARHLHAHVKLFGELLAHIKTSPEDRELLKVAQRFNLAWTSLDQVNRRLSWMQALGLLERWGYGKLVVTEKGRQFLETIELATPESVAPDAVTHDEESPDLSEPQPFLVQAFDRLKPADLKNRRVLIGYVPRGRKGAGRASEGGSPGIFEALRKYLDLIGSSASSDEIYEKAVAAFGQKKSSYTQSMHTLRNMGVIEMVSFNRYGIPGQIATIVQTGSEVDFVRHLHLRYRFVGELLVALEGNASVRGLAEFANEKYGLNQIDNAEIRTRLSFLAEAGLVERIDWSRYRITANGRALISELTLEAPLESATATEAGSAADESHSRAASSFEEVASGINEELRRYGNVGNASAEFERAVARGFELFGFRVEHLGGPGRTDVLLTVEQSPSERYRAIVDAKSSSTGVISDNALTFDVIRDHRSKHKADYAAVVGPEFTPRLKEWAVNHKVKLITVEELIGLIELHQNTPLPLPELKILFETSDDLTDVYDAYGVAAGVSEILTKIIDVLYQEANDEDPIAEGYISAENIYFTLRKELSPRPSRDSINECLEFLASSVVRALHKKGDKYKLADVPSNIDRRLFGLSSSIGSVILPEQG